MNKKTHLDLPFANPAGFSLPEPKVPGELKV